MDKKQFGVIMTTIISVFKIQSETKQAMAIWYKALNDLDYDLATKAVDNLIQTHSGFIAPADIRKACVEVLNPKVGFTEAYQLTNDVIRKFGRYQQVEAMEYLKSKNEAMHKVVRAIGFNNLCNTDLSYTRGAMERMYKEVVVTGQQANLLTNHKDDINEIKKLALGGQ